MTWILIGELESDQQDTDQGLQVTQMIKEN